MSFPHYHYLFFRLPFLEADRLNRMWAEVLDWSSSVRTEIKGVRSWRQAFYYAAKYMAKPVEAAVGVSAVYVAQSTENTPAGRMMRRTLANMASFYTEQQSLDVKEGLARRVQDGLFVGHAPYGYQNVRVDGRSLVEVHPVHGSTVRRMFELYAYHSHALDSVIRALEAEGLTFTEARPRFVRSKVHGILRDRAYIGEIRYRGAW